VTTHVWCVVCERRAGGENKPITDGWRGDGRGDAGGRRVCRQGVGGRATKTLCAVFLVFLRVIAVVSVQSRCSGYSSLSAIVLPLFSTVIIPIFLPFFLFRHFVPRISADGLPHCAAWCGLYDAHHASGVSLWRERSAAGDVVETWRTAWPCGVLWAWLSASTVFIHLLAIRQRCHHRGGDSTDAIAFD